jgi:hypothetical protein
MARRDDIQPPTRIDWPRADPSALASFDPHTKICTMNCGPSRDDPRTWQERQLLCTDCLPRTALSPTT